MKLICVIGNSVPWKHYRQTTLYEAQSRKTVFVSIYRMNYEYVRSKTNIVMIAF
jgi:hypothetical protein